MKARIPPQRRISKQVLSAMDEYNAQESYNMSRRFFKLMAMSLNDLYGFGPERVKKASNYIGQLIADHQDDEIFWQHVDQRCDQLKLGYEHEDYEKMESGRKGG